MHGVMGGERGRENTPTYRPPACWMANQVFQTREKDLQFKGLLYLNMMMLVSKLLLRFRKLKEMKGKALLTEMVLRQYIIEESSITGYMTNFSVTLAVFIIKMCPRMHIKLCRDRNALYFLNSIRFLTTGHNLN